MTDQDRRPEHRRAGIYAVQAVSAVVTGWVSDRWIVAGATPNRVQKTLLVTAMVGVALTMMACAAAGPTLSVALLAAAAMFFGMTVPNIYAIAQTLGGHRAAGQSMGIQNLIGNLAGVLAPLITGFVVDRTDHYYWAFVIAALIAFVGSLAFGVVIRRIEPIAWSKISLAPATVLE
jgi:MFS family permease